MFRSGGSLSSPFLASFTLRFPGLLCGYLFLRILYSFTLLSLVPPFVFCLSVDVFLSLCAYMSLCISLYVCVSRYIYFKNTDYLLVKTALLFSLENFQNCVVSRGRLGSQPPFVPPRHPGNLPLAVSQGLPFMFSR